MLLNYCFIDPRLISTAISTFVKITKSALKFTVFSSTGKRSVLKKARDSSVGIATCYRLDGPGIESRWRAKFSATVQNGSEAHPVPIQWVSGVFPRGKAVGAWSGPPIPSSAEVKERVGLYLYSPSGPSWPVVG